MDKYSDFTSLLAKLLACGVCLCVCVALSLVYTCVALTVKIEDSCFFNQDSLCNLFIDTATS